MFKGGHVFIIGSAFSLSSKSRAFGTHLQFAIMSGNYNSVNVFGVSKLEFWQTRSWGQVINYPPELIDVFI